MYAAPEQQPIPCQRCGAGMVPTEQPVLYANELRMGCRFCGAVETVSNDDRLRVSRERVAMLRMAQDAAEAPARHADQIIAMRPWLGGALVGGVMLLNGFNGVSQALGGIDRAGAAMSADDRLDALLTVCVMPAMGVGVAAGMFLGWTLALRRYRALVTPMRRARAPIVPGAPARCRCCGADLPSLPGAFARCGFCNTHNLLDRALMDERESLLQQETAGYQQRAAGVLARANAFSPTFTRWSLVGAGLGAVTMAVVGALVAVILSRG